MNSKPIREYSKKALINIANHLEFSDKYSKEPVTQNICYTDFESIGIDLITMLNAIEFIGFNGSDKDLGTCAGLAQIAQKMLPNNELKFLDSLLIKTENSKEVFEKIEKL